MASSSGLDGAASLDRTCSSMSGSSCLTIALVFLRRDRKYCVGSASFRQISRLGGGLNWSLWVKRSAGWHLNLHFNPRCL